MYFTDAYAEGAVGGGGSNTILFCLLGCQRETDPTFLMKEKNESESPPPPPPPLHSATFSGLARHHSLHPIVKYLTWENPAYAIGTSYVLRLDKHVQITFHVFQ